MTNPTRSGFYWVWVTPAGSDRGSMGDGPEVMYFDETDREWWAVGLDYPFLKIDHVRGILEEMHAWVGPLTPPEAPR